MLNDKKETRKKKVRKGAGIEAKSGSGPTGGTAWEKKSSTNRNHRQQGGEICQKKCFQGYADAEVKDFG